MNIEVVSAADQENAVRQILKQIITENIKRGEVLLYTRYRTQDSLSIGILGDSLGGFLFEATNSPQEAESREVMLIKKGRPTIARVKKHLKPYFRRQHKELASLPIRLIDNIHAFRATPKEAVEEKYPLM